MFSVSCVNMPPVMLLLCFQTSAVLNLHLTVQNWRIIIFALTTFSKYSYSSILFACFRSSNLASKNLELNLVFVHVMKIFKRITISCSFTPFEFKSAKIWVSCPVWNDPSLKTSCACIRSVNETYSDVYWFFLVYDYEIVHNLVIFSSYLLPWIIFCILPSSLPRYRKPHFCIFLKHLAQKNATLSTKFTSVWRGCGKQG